MFWSGIEFGAGFALAWLAVFRFFAWSFKRTASITHRRVMQEALRHNERRQALIEEETESCTECGRLGYPKNANCDACTDAVDERLAQERTR